MLSQTDDPRGFTADVVLAEARAARLAQVESAATMLQAAAVWADLHPGLDPEWIACDRMEDDLPLAGGGTPSVDARCIAELGAVLGLSSGAAQQLIGDALELRHRLPRLWARVMGLRVPAWEARRVAQCTPHLSRDAVAYVDAQLQALPRIPAGRAERFVDVAVARFMPDLAEAQRQRASELRRVDIEPVQPGNGPLPGLASVSGVLDLADALDLDKALTTRAAELGRLGVDGSVQVRRSIALGDLARAHQDTLDLSEKTSTPRPVPARQVVLHVHLTEAALTSANEVAWLDRHTTARADLVDVPVLTGQVRGWCASPEAKVTVKPVIDCEQTIAVPGYQVPDRILERLKLRDAHCVFPHCRNRRVDADHRIPYDHDHPDQGGQTSTDGLSLLCRRHHRLKTYTRWRYRMIRAGCYHWTSPHGHRYLRDEHGTYSLE